MEQKLGEAVSEGKIFTYFLLKDREFGIKISSSCGETGEIRNVFPDKKEAQKFIELLCEGMVTPTTLLDVVTDYIDARDFISWHLR